MLQFKQVADYPLTGSAPHLDYGDVRAALAGSPDPVVVPDLDAKLATAVQAQAKNALGVTYKVRNLKARSGADEKRDVVITRETSKPKDDSES